MARSILFSSPMVRALLDGRKTQTRRVLTGDKPNSLFNGQWADSYVLDPGNQSWRDQEVRYAVGDRLYVREAWHAARSLDRTPPRDIPHDADIEYTATARSYAEIGLKGKLRPPMFLPRWASRLTLTVTDVRVQRLQDISEAEAIAEGLEHDIDGDVDGHGRHIIIESWRGADYLPWTGDPIEAYADLWDQLNHARGYGWDANPWVVAVSFTVERRNIDQVAS